MESQINQLVDIYFNNVPYSNETAEARENIEGSLNDEYKKLAANMNEDEAFEQLVAKYNKLTDMAELAGFSAEDTEKWRSDDEIFHIKAIKKKITKQRRRVYFTSFFVVAGFVQLLWVLYMLFVKPKWAAANFIYALVMFFAAHIFFKKYQNTEKNSISAKYDNESFEWLCSMTDRYIKRKLNNIALIFAVFFIFIFSEISFFISGNSKSAEFVDNILTNIVVLEIPLYLYVKNLLCLKIFQGRINSSKTKRYKKHNFGIIIFSAAYWILVTVFIGIFGHSMRYRANILIILGILFVLLMLVYDLTLRKKIVYKNIVLNKPKLALVITAVLCSSFFSFLQRDTWYTQTYINSVPVIEHNENKIHYDDETGVYTITSSDEDFKILHLTDIHIGGSLYSYFKDIKALKACYAEIEYTKPDLVVVTGDLCFPMGIMSMSLNNTAPVNQFAAFMRNIGIPWCFTYGNHDTESIATANKNQLNEIYKSLSYKTSGNLLYPYTQPDVTGRNNQVIEIRNADGKLNTALFLIDSNAYTGEGINVYDYIHDDQVEWYTQEVERLNSLEGHTVNSLAFFHIPLQEYRTAYELYESGSDEVKYYFGENGEKMIDKVCCSDYPSKLFDRMLELQSTTGTFCGHDHYNNMSLEYKGIRLTYGMSIDYLAMPGIEDDTDQRGAELITLHSDSSWDLVQIPLVSIT